MPHFVGWTAAAVAGLAAVVLASLLGGGCATEPTTPTVTDPNAGLLRDFLDGKYDGAGHPLNAHVNDTALRLAGACTAAITGGGSDGSSLATPTSTLRPKRGLRRSCRSRRSRISNPRAVSIRRARGTGVRSSSPRRS